MADQVEFLIDHPELATSLAVASTAPRKARKPAAKPAPEPELTVDDCYKSYYAKLYRIRGKPKPLRVVPRQGAT